MIRDHVAPFCYKWCEEGDRRCRAGNLRCRRGTGGVRRTQAVTICAARGTASASAELSETEDHDGRLQVMQAVHDHPEQRAERARRPITSPCRTPGRAITRRRRRGTTTPPASRATGSHHEVGQAHSQRHGARRRRTRTCCTRTRPPPTSRRTSTTPISTWPGEPRRIDRSPRRHRESSQQREQRPTPCPRPVTATRAGDHETAGQWHQAAAQHPGAQPHHHKAAQDHHETHGQGSVPRRVDD